MLRNKPITPTFIRKKIDERRRWKEDVVTAAKYQHWTGVGTIGELIHTTRDKIKWSEVIANIY